ncbi:MAG: polysaccharide deacetylase family protein [Eubacterium sp.]
MVELLKIQRMLQLMVKRLQLKQRKKTVKPKRKTTKDNKRVIDPNKPMIALTFDDGPGERTLELLETLEKYKVRASFFMCGTSLSRNDIRWKKF